MGAPTVLSQIDGVALGTPMHAPTDPDESLGYTEAERQQQMADALRAYRGRLQKPLKKKARQPDLNLRTNRCRPIVDTGVAFLFGKEVLFAIAASAGKPAQDDLDACWKANKKAATLNGLATNGGIFGDGYVKVLDASEGVVADGQAYPRIVVLDPQQVTVETDPDDCTLATAFNIHWQGVDARGKPVQRRQRIARADLAPGGDVDANGTKPLGAPEQWVIQNQVQIGTGTDGTARWADDGPPIAWDYGWCPIHHVPNLAEPNSYFGASDLTADLIELQRALNFALSNRHTILYHHAHPKTWGRGFLPSQLTLGVDDVMVIQAADGSLQNLEMTGDLQGLANHIEDIRADMDEISGVPSVAFGRLKDMVKGALPGITIRMMFQPLVTKTEKKRTTYGDVLQQLNAHLLEMMEHGQGVSVDNVWQDVLPVNMAEWAVFAPILGQMGVSQQTLVGEAGYDWHAEQERKAEEDAAAMRQVMKGQAIPEPPDPTDPNAPVAPNAAQPSPVVPGQPPVAPSAPNGQVPPTNHPAAVAARQRMQAANGKAPTPGGL